MPSDLSRAAPTPANEPARLAALRSFGILDTGLEKAFDDIAGLAAHICQTPIAVINFIDAERQWFKSEIGLGVRETPLAPSICAHAILQSDLFVVPDTMRDERFRTNPLVTGDPKLRFYAGAPLMTTDDFPLGTVCVLDTKPRMLHADQLAALRALARQVMALLELRRSLALAERLSQFRSRLMATLGHDLKAPLRRISYALHRVSQHVDTEGAGYVERAASAVAEADADLNQILAAATSDESMPRATEFPVAEVMDALHDKWAASAQAREVRLDYVPSSARIASHPILLSTILGNFLSNAVKYTPHGRIVFGVRRRGAFLHIVVADNGIGMREDRVEDLFEAFRQSDPQAEGLGLGLWIASKTAALLNHDIGAQSRLDRGSVFFVRVPLAS